jgi:hypothetical protein
MKHLTRTIIAVFLAVLMAALLPVQVFADTPDYVSEVKAFIGNYNAAADEGYTILNGDNGKPVDLNQGAGGGWGSQGDKAVYLGYKTTKDRKKAITDLALMNMKGGYSVQEYEALMETQMKSQIIPFVDSFLATINEYRENMTSETDLNRERAEYIREILNKLIDDDTGKGLGDLLLNKTKYEMGDEAYNKLSAEEKKNHADIVTIIAQANGKATQLMETLLLRGADTNDDAWIDRFSELDYDMLVEATGEPPSTAAKELAKLYDDDAQTVLDMWDAFCSELEQYDYYKGIVDNYKESDVDNASDKMDAFKELDENASDEELLDAVEGYGEAIDTASELTKALKVVYIHDTLDEYLYADGTMLDFFLTDGEEMEDNIEALYPLVASLTEGQKAGLELVSLDELFMMAVTDREVYREKTFNDLEEVSIYDGVDRGIYQKGGVALTSDAMRKEALEQSTAEESPLSGLTIAGIVVTGVCVLAAIATGIGIKAYSVAAQNITLKLYTDVAGSGKYFTTRLVGVKDGVPQFENRCLNTIYASRSSLCKYLTVGLSVAAVILAGVTTYLTYRDMVNHYKVDFTPIPHYMVDEKDLISYNKKGEKIILKNQSAYYKAAESNLKKGDFKFDEIGALADMNGCVGKQWLALYLAKNTNMNPILAASLKIVTGSSEIPAGYTSGIHMFGSDAAFNLNSSLYDWNSGAKSVFVYFKTDDSAKASTTGSNFTGGTLALTGVAGIALGAVITAFATKSKRNKNENKAVAA